MNNDIFWSRVKELLKAQCLTQETICSRVNIPIGTMRGWITHSRLPDAEMSCLIAAELGTTVEFLVTGGNPSPQRDLSKERAVELARKIIETLQ